MGKKEREDSRMYSLGLWPEHLVEQKHILLKWEIEGLAKARDTTQLGGFSIMIVM